MPTINEVRNVLIRATTQGVSESAAALKKMEGGLQGVASVSETTTRKTRSVSVGFESLQKNLDKTYRASQAFEKQQETLNRALAIGLVTQQRYSELMVLATARLNANTVAATAANDNLAKSIDRATKAHSGYHEAISLAQRAMGAIGLAAGGKALIGYADTWSDAQSRVGAAIKDMEAAPAMMQRIVDIANASYSPLSQTVEVYSRNASVLRALGLGANEAADFTEALNHSLVITATRGERAASVQDALSKAMAIGKLQADGLETVLANGGRVAEALAKELGTSVNGLRGLASQGKITGNVIANALIGSISQLRKEAAEMPATIGDALTRIQTNFTAFIGQTDKATGVSEAFAGGLIKVGDNIGRLVTYGATAATAYGTYYVGAFVAARAATLGLTGSLALLRGALIRTGVGALIVGAGELVYQFGRLVDATGSWSGAFEQLSDRSRILLDATVWGFQSASESIQAIWASTLASILRSTEENFGSILRLFGVSADDMAKSIAGLEQRSKQMGALAEKSAGIAAGQFNRAFAGIYHDADKIADGGRKIAASIEDVSEAAKKSAQDLEKFKTRADALAEEMFPGEYARREAEELSALLDRFGNKLDEFQRKAVEHRIDTMFASAAAGVRDLSKETVNCAREMERALRPVASILGGLFDGSIKSMDQFLDSFTSNMSRMAQNDIMNALKNGLTAANDNGPDIAGVIGKEVQKGAKKGTQEGSFGGTLTGMFTALGMSGENAKMAGGYAAAGLGGFGMGYQVQDPMMGAAGGAVSGSIALGTIAPGFGYIAGAIVGGIAGALGDVGGRRRPADREEQHKESEDDRDQHRRAA